MELQGADHVAFRVPDQDAAIAWFEDVLGLRREHPRWERSPQMVGRGGSGVALLAAEPGAHGVPVRFADHESAHSLSLDGPAGIRLELTTYELA